MEFVSGPDPIDKQPLKKSKRYKPPSILLKFFKTKSPI